MDIKIRADLLARIKKYVKEGRYKDVSEFLNSATETLLMAEDRSGMFKVAISRAAGKVPEPESEEAGEEKTDEER